MTKEESLKILGDAKIDVSLTDKGEIRAGLLELAAKGVQADEAKKGYETTIELLNDTIDALEKKKTPAARKDLIEHAKSEKRFTLAQPKSSFRGRKITVFTLNNNQALLEELMESKSPILVEYKEA